MQRLKAATTTLDRLQPVPLLMIGVVLLQQIFNVAAQVCCTWALKPGIRMAGKPVITSMPGVLLSAILLIIFQQSGIQRDGPHSQQTVSVVLSKGFHHGTSTAPDASLLCSADHRVLNRAQVEDINHVVNQVSFGTRAHVFGIAQPRAVLQVLPDCQVLMHNVILHAHTHARCDIGVEWSEECEEALRLGAGEGGAERDQNKLRVGS